jgi:CHAT domain-containing protein
MYRIRQAEPRLGKGEALRQAQEEMANGVLTPTSGSVAGRGFDETDAEAGSHQSPASNWTHPYYWAPFILIGNWR